MPGMIQFPQHGPDNGDGERKAPVLVMPAQESRPSAWELWRGRLFLVEFMFVCVVVGILLIAAPWTVLWTNNSLLAGYPQVHEFLMNDFVRGLVSGLGVVDIGLAVAEAAGYREYVE
ncbi:MAG TPA: hypothetical protein VMD98_01365 [Bryocella sp.]|nr:hypothetical protein [Bryocella sp.]